jgi:hypothetical protein
VPDAALREEMGRDARRLAAERFSEEASVSALEALFEEVGAEPRSGVLSMPAAPSGAKVGGRE